jgi:hypothetical protein
MVQIYCIIFNLFIKSDDIDSTDLTTYTPQNFKKFLGKYFIERNWSSANYNNYRKYLRCYCEFLKTE